MCQWSVIFCNPGIVDSPDIRKSREIKSTISTKLPSQQNSFGPSSEKPQIDSGFIPINFTHEDVIKGNNAVYGSQLSHSQLSNGGVFFAISGQSGGMSTPLSNLMSAGLFKNDLFIFFCINLLFFITITQHLLNLSCCNICRPKGHQNKPPFNIFNCLDLL